MKEFIEKLIGRLEEKKSDLTTWSEDKAFEIGIETAISIVNQLAEEHNFTPCYLGSPCEYQNEEAKMPQEYWDKGWIVCSESLPEEKGDYLVTCNDGKVRVWWFVVEGDFKCWLRGVHQLKPIAWQPLPAPYQPKGE